MIRWLAFLDQPSNTLIIPTAYTQHKLQLPPLPPLRLYSPITVTMSLPLPLSPPPFSVSTQTNKANRSDPIPSCEPLPPIQQPLHHMPSGKLAKVSETGHTTYRTFGGTCMGGGGSHDGGNTRALRRVLVVWPLGHWAACS